MALYYTPDGRVIIGTGVSDGNDYHGYNGKRDIVIQLTEDGATTDGLNALEYLKSYAENAKAENKPIFPDGTRVFISANGYTKAVEADDVVIDGENISIGGIAWNGSAWDFSNAGQSGGGGGGQLPTPTAQDVGKVATVVGETSKGAVIAPEQSVTVSGEDGAVLSNANISLFTVGTYCAVTINGTDYSGTVEERKGFPTLAFSLGVGHGEAIFGAINGNLLFVAESGTYTVSVNVASTSVSYGLSAPSGVVLVVHEDIDDETLDKTWEEINAAVKSGLVYVGRQFGDEVVNRGIIYSAEKERNNKGEVIGYIVRALYRSSATPSFRDWTTETADGYPELLV